MNCTLDMYVDYLLSATKLATATGMSEMFNGEISHDKVTRFLTESYLDSATVWTKAKRLVRGYEDAEEGVLIADDTIIEKAYTDENAMICWHWDHSLGRNVKGINLLSLLLHAGDLSIPINAHAVEKTEQYLNKKTGTTKYRSPTTKNDITRAMLLQAKAQNIQYRYFLADSWFSSAETMRFVAEELQKFYILSVESSRTVALSERDRGNGIFHRVDSLNYPDDGHPMRVFLRSVPHAVVLSRRIFTNKDGSQGVLYLVSNDTTLDDEAIAAIYKKRWKVEEYHKSLKQHTAIAKSPTKNIRTQANHLFASLVAYVKLESIKLKLGGNHFSIKALLVTVATKAAFMALSRLCA